MTPKKDDSFFQLSLTELAFILVFVVLLLIGAKFVIIGTDTNTCNTALSACNNKVSACTKERDSCMEALAKGGNNPDVVIDSLVNAPKLRKENEELQARTKKLESELTALEELKKKIPNPVRLKTAEDFLSAYEKGAKTNVPMETATKEGEEAANRARELENCRGQVKHCVTASARKGYGLPPCWTDSSAKIQYLMDVEIRPDGLAVTKAWPPEREEDARQLPGLQTTINAGLQSLDQFKLNTQPIFDLSRKANPECRHYVVIRRAQSLREIDLFNRLRLGIEDHFYKLDKTGAGSK